MAYKINVGDPIPSFVAIDSEGEELTDEDLIGTPFVIYFYPKDDTPGCTKEACDFRDNMSKWDALDVTVIGISPDGIKSHENFIKKHGLNFPLIPDERKELCRKFDVLREGNILERTTFVVDYEGVVQWIERPVAVPGHIERVLEALTEIRDHYPI